MQSQMDWGHFGNWGGRRLYGFAAGYQSVRRFVHKLHPSYGAVSIFLAEISAASVTYCATELRATR